MNIRVSGIVNDSIVDGPGLRMTIFTQGCPHHCLGCHNPQSHDFEGGELREIRDIVDMARDNILLDGITLSGGEPFAQAEACAVIAGEMHKIGLNVWCYTGYTFEQLINGGEGWRALLENIDVLVDGPFILDQKTFDAKFRGSSNQRILDIPKSLNAGKAVLSEYN